MRIGDIEGESADAIAMTFDQIGELRGIARSRYKFMSRRQHRLGERAAQSSGTTSNKPDLCHRIFGS
jgi:hypothetical protein